MRTTTNPLRLISYVIVGVAGMMALALPAAAQSGEITSAGVGTCTAQANITITVLGLTQTKSQCINSTQQSTPGTDNQSVASANIGAGLTIAGQQVQLVNVASVQAASGTASIATMPETTQVGGQTNTGQVAAAQGMVDSKDVQGNLTCQNQQGSRVISCQSGTTVGQLQVAGQPISLPAPIPFNSTIGVNGTLQLQVGALPVLNVPVTGAVTLNELRVTGAGVGAVQFAEGNSVEIGMAQAGGPVNIQSNTLALRLSGSVNVLGLGLIQVQVEVLDDTEVDLGGVGASV